MKRPSKPAKKPTAPANQNQAPVMRATRVVFDKSLSPELLIGLLSSIGHCASIEMPASGPHNYLTLVSSAFGETMPGLCMAQINGARTNGAEAVITVKLVPARIAQSQRPANRKARLAAAAEARR